MKAQLQVYSQISRSKRPRIYDSEYVYVINEKVRKGSAICIYCGVVSRLEHGRAE